MIWKIYINYGTQEEFDLVEQLSFNTKKEAEQWCKNHRYPLKCVMKESEYNCLKSN